MASSRARNVLAAASLPITVRAHQFDATDTLREYARSRVALHFARMRRRIERITVQFEDLNGPKGGKDAVCKILVSVSGHEPAAVAAVHEDAYAAVDVAVNKAVAAYKHIVRRRHDRRERGQAFEARAALYVL